MTFKDYLSLAGFALCVVAVFVVTFTIGDHIGAALSPWAEEPPDSPTSPAPVVWHHQHTTLYCQQTDLGAIWIAEAIYSGVSVDIEIQDGGTCPQSKP